MAMATALAVDPGESVVGKKQLCGLLGWSRPTLDRRIDQDPNFPIRRRGTQGGGWEFDVPAVFSYLRPGITPVVRAPLALASEVQAPAPAAIAAEPPPAHGNGPRLAHQGEETARQRRDAVQAQLLEDRLRKSRGELVDAAEMRTVLSTAVTKLSASLNALPDVLVRRLSLPDAAGLIVRQEIEEARRAFFASLREVLEGE